jgi:hypothetical protein
MNGLGLGSKNMLFIFRYPCLFTFREHNDLFHFEKRIKVHQYGYPMKGQVTWHETGRVWRGRVVPGGDGLVRDGSGGDGSGGDGSGSVGLGDDGSGGDGSGGERSGSDGLGGDRSGEDGSGGENSGKNGLVGDGSVGNGSVMKKVAADPPFNWFFADSENELIFQIF